MGVVFCVVWSFCIYVSAVSGCQAVCAYVRMGVMSCMYSVFFLFCTFSFAY